jgi:hypothetical protein
MALRRAASFVIGLLAVVAICPMLAQQSDSVRVLAQAEPQVKWESRGRVTGDFDCDGRSDEPFLGRQQRRIYVGIVRSGGQTPDVLNFGVDERYYPGICGQPADRYRHSACRCAASAPLLMTDADSYGCALGADIDASRRR